METEPKDIMRTKGKLGGSERGRGKGQGVRDGRERNWEKAELRMEDKVLPGSKEVKLWKTAHLRIHSPNQIK